MIGRAEPEVDVAADHPVERRTGQVGEGRVGGIPAQRRAPGEGVALALEEFAHRFEQGTRGGLVETERVRIGHRHVLAADMPVRRCDEPPGRVADRDAVALRGAGGKGQGAVGPAPAPGRRERALVRR